MMSQAVDHRIVDRMSGGRYAQYLEKQKNHEAALSEDER